MNAWLASYAFETAVIGVVVAITGLITALAGYIRAKTQLAVQQQQLLGQQRQLGSLEAQVQQHTQQMAAPAPASTVVNVPPGTSQVTIAAPPTPGAPLSVQGESDGQ